MKQHVTGILLLIAMIMLVAGCSQADDIAGSAAEKLDDAETAPVAPEMEGTSVIEGELTDQTCCGYCASKCNSFSPPQICAICEPRSNGCFWRCGDPKPKK